MLQLQYTDLLAAGAHWSVISCSTLIYQLQYIDLLSAAVHWSAISYRTLICHQLQYIDLPSAAVHWSAVAAVHWSATAAVHWSAILWFAFSQYVALATVFILCYCPSLVGRHSWRPCPADFCSLVLTDILLHCCLYIWYIMYAHRPALIYIMYAHRPALSYIMYAHRPALSSFHLAKLPADPSWTCSCTLTACTGWHPSRPAKQNTNTNADRKNGACTFKNLNRAKPNVRNY